MGRKQRKGRGGASAATRGSRRQIVPWRERAREVLGRLRDYARDRAGDEIEAYLRESFAEQDGAPDVHDLQRAFDDYVAMPGTAGEERSLLRAFTEEADAGLQAEERAQLVTWEHERRRKAYLLDRCYRDRMELWDPLGGGREVLHLIEKMPPARAAALPRGTVVIAASVPFGQRRVVLGQVEFYEGDDALEMYRGEVTSEGRIWHDLPPPAPVA